MDISSESLRRYFYENFPDQLMRIEHSAPDGYVRHVVMKDASVEFFGIHGWKSIRKDLLRIPQQHHAPFILSLFMIVVVDQCLYTYFNAAYPAWRQATNYPKFGWANYQPHNENPFKLLWIPEHKKLIKVSDVTDLLPTFVSFMLSETTRYLKNWVPGVEPTKFFECICHDDSYAFSKGAILASFKTEFERQRPTFEPTSSNGQIGPLQ